MVDAVCISEQSLIQSVFCTRWYDINVYKHIKKYINTIYIYKSKSEPAFLGDGFILTFRNLGKIFHVNRCSITNLQTSQDSKLHNDPGSRALPTSTCFTWGSHSLGTPEIFVCSLGCTCGFRSSKPWWGEMAGDGSSLDLSFFCCRIWWKMMKLVKNLELDFCVTKQVWSKNILMMQWSNMLFKQPRRTSRMANNHDITTKWWHMLQ